MGKHFRLRIFRIIPCGSSKDNNNNNPIPVPTKSSFCRFSPVTPTVLPKPKPHRAYSIKRHVSSALGSCGWTARSRPPISSDDDRDRTGSPKPVDHFFQWEKEEKFWQVVEITETPRKKIYNSSADENDDDFDVVLPPPPPPPPSSAEKNKTTKRRVEHKKKKKKKKKDRTSSTRLGPFRLSTSSAESGLFTSETLDEDDETETLVSSSRSLSTDSSSHGRRRRIKTKKKKKTKRCVSEAELMDESTHSPARLSVFQRMIPCTVAGKVRESFAVVKRSDDPYEDFKSSMAEMILEKQMFEDEDLEQLLHCFLSLNSRNHHGDIVRAFIEIWEALFSVGNGSARSSRRVSRALSLS